MRFVIYTVCNVDARLFDFTERMSITTTKAIKYTIYYSLYILIYFIMSHIIISTIIYIALVFTYFLFVRLERIFTQSEK